jgi:hypothetical protein
LSLPFTGFQPWFSTLVSQEGFPKKGFPKILSQKDLGKFVNMRFAIVFRPFRLRWRLPIWLPFVLLFADRHGSLPG